MILSALTLCRFTNYDTDSCPPFRRSARVNPNPNPNPDSRNGGPPGMGGRYDDTCCDRASKNSLCAFNGHFLHVNPDSRYQNVSILDFIGAKDDGGGEW